MFHRIPRSVIAAALSGLAILPALAVPSWIWSDSPASKAAANFRKSFEVAAPLRNATLVLTCDNGARVLLDEIGRAHV